MDQLTSLRQFTDIVADTGNINEIKLYQPKDATTNPSLILQASKMPEYHSLLKDAISWAKRKNSSFEKQLQDASDKIAVNIGLEILKFIPGRISTEINAKYSYDINASIKHAKKLIKLYNNAGIKNSSILIKIAATWQGIKAAEKLEKEGINCNLTLLFSFAQAKACAEAGVFLISPFVGRILDWHIQKKIENLHQDPGVVSVSKIYQYYKKYNYKTVIMGASFRNIEEILQLAGCDRLTISPIFLKKLSETKGNVERKLFFIKKSDKNNLKKIKESQFLWEHNQDPMAVEKLSQGIRDFFIDQKKLENIISSFL